MSGTKKQSSSLGGDTNNDRWNKGIQKHFGREPAGSWESDEDFMRSLMTQPSGPEEHASEKIHVSVYEAKKKQPLNFDRFSLELNSKPDLVDWTPDTTGCMLSISGHIMGHQREAEPTIIGHLEAWLVRCELARSIGVDLWNIMDGHSDELGDIAEQRTRLIYTNGSWRGSDCTFDNLLYVHKVSLEEQFRGYGIALLAVDAIIGSRASFQAVAPARFEISLPFVKADTEDDESDWETRNYPGRDLVLISPSGLREKDILFGPNPDHDRTVQKLTAYWSKLGFYVLGSNIGTHDTVMALQTWFPRPKIREVVPHLVATGQAGQ